MNPILVAWIVALSVAIFLAVRADVQRKLLLEERNALREQLARAMHAIERGPTFVAEIVSKPAPASEPKKAIGYRDASPHNSEVAQLKLMIAERDEDI